MFKKTRGRTPWPPWGAGSIMTNAKRAIVDLLPLLPIADEMLRTAYDAAKERYEELRAGLGGADGGG